MVKRSGGRRSSRFSLAGSVMLTRRTATVTISAPETSTAFRVSANEAYLPVPTISRDRKLFPARTKGSSPAISAAPDEVDDLDRVALGETMRRVIRARHHGAVHLDRDPARPQSEARDQVGDGGVRRELARLVIHSDPHGVKDLPPACRDVHHEVPANPPRRR